MVHTHMNTHRSGEPAKDKVYEQQLKRAKRDAAPRGEEENKTGEKGGWGGSAPIRSDPLDTDGAKKRKSNGRRKYLDRRQTASTAFTALHRPPNKTEHSNVGHLERTLPQGTRSRPNSMKRINYPRRACWCMIFLATILQVVLREAEQGRLKIWGKHIPPGGTL